jgi:transitional endoplasmic reticulum ATPase
MFQPQACWSASSFNVFKVDTSDNSSDFLQRKMLTYTWRLLNVNLNFDREVFNFLYWLIRSELANDYVKTIRVMVPEHKRSKDDDLDDSIEESWDFASACFETIKLLSRESRNRARIEARRLLELRIDDLPYSGSTTIEENLLEFKRMFNLDDVETELCLFLFIMTSYNEFSSFFETHLQCNRYQGRKWLVAVLGCDQGAAVKALNGKLHQIGILVKDNYRGSFELEQLFRQQLQDLNPGEFRSQFTKLLKCESIPLESHTIDKTITRNLLNKLCYKPETSSNVLLYGPPGTGKTSYAYGIAKKLGLACYQLDVQGKESPSSRRVAITASVNMISETDNALLIADDCDSILNTKNSWSLSGETPDKPWIHEILEKPGIRMIWIVNSVENIEESVARRFCFSLGFKPFNRRQRIQLWKNIVQKHKVDQFLSDSEVEYLSNRFEVSPGLIDQAVRKVAESKNHCDEDLKESVILTLESHVRLGRGGNITRNWNFNHEDFTLDGLNLSGTNPHILLEELTIFNEFSKKPNPHGPVSMSLLFHGPPGSGKSELARFIADHLDKEIVFKRASDIFSKWVGDTEKNICEAYEEANSKEAVLIFDEADSLIFNRDRAEHSWELSFTNEFLTWMESFEGIQIFTTNRLKDLDNASLRRFNHKIEFGYLKPDGNVIFYEKLIAPLGRGPFDPNIAKALKGLTGLTPGDFKVVRDMFAFRNKKDITHNLLLKALKEEAKLKDCHAGVKNIGFLS